MLHYPFFEVLRKLLARRARSTAITIHSVGASYLDTAENKIEIADIHLESASNND
jgi:hypothetical protein